MRVNKFVRLLLLPFLLLGSLAAVSQEFTPFTRTYPSGTNFRYQTNIKGDLTFIANDIVNRDGGTNTTRPEDPYNLTGDSSEPNDRLNIRYIDIDNDATTFNSSSATLYFDQPDCNKIIYAALYWTATYVENTDGTRSADFNQVKLKVPNGTYEDITANEILFDGGTSTDPTILSNSPYACFADVTTQLISLADPTGSYTVANIRSSQSSSIGGGISGGWTLVVVYENPTLSGKLITTFDGFARVNRDNSSISIDYSGFTTIPAGPINATIGAGVLEGDNRIVGDQMSIRAASNFLQPFYLIRNNLNPVNNFFNSNISVKGVAPAGRVPSSENTLGFDVDLINLPTNTIPNNETSATFRFTSQGDQYYPFFNSFNVEIIEPDIILEKRVQNIAGDDITGMGVFLGQNLDYMLSFDNIGNDDVDGYIIRDVLPINVTLDESNLTLPTGVTYTFEASTRTITFSIPNNLVTKTSPESIIRMRVRVAENCFDFIDACTDLIENLAYSTYRGVINDNQITDDPSVRDFNICGFVTPGATNFLLDDLDSCDFKRTVQLCGENTTLSAGKGFDSYTWVRDDNNNGIIDSTDTIINDSNPDNDSSTRIVNISGTYIVDKVVADPCKGFKEIIVVERFGDDTSHPIITYLNEINSDSNVSNDIQSTVVSCSIDGDLLPKIFLCGTDDTASLQVNIIDANSIVWEQLNESSCASSGDDCANKNLSCSWSQISSGRSYTATTAGKFRLVIRYQNGCINRFYFNVFQNNLNITYTKRDVVCESSGNITITNIGSDYGFQLINTATNTIAIPFSANNGASFDFTSSGSYSVEVAQIDSTTGMPINDGCVFSTPEIGILNRDLDMNLNTSAVTCNAQGSIQVDALDVFPNYNYELRLDDGTPPPAVGDPLYYPSHPGGTFIDNAVAQSLNTYTFNVSEGDYFVITRTDDDCLDVQSTEVVRIPDPTLSALTVANINCTAGTIQLTRTGGLGNPGFQFAIWSKDGVLLHDTTGTSTEEEIVANIDPNAFQTEDIFTFGWRDTDNDFIDEYFSGEEGTYSFIVVDANNCYALSNEAIILDEGDVSIDTISETQPSCNGDNDGQLVINVIQGARPYRYSIDDGVRYQNSNVFVGLSSGTFNIRVVDANGCEVSQEYILEEPTPFSASAGVLRNATCNPAGAEVRVTNIVGGNLPYEFSFDGGSTWGTTSTAILPPGTYTIFIRDTSCTFPMSVTVEDIPTPPDVALTPEVDYSCDGNGIITATPSISGYNYRFELDGVENTPDASNNIFTNVASGSYTVSTYYTSQVSPAPSILLSENFGTGFGTIPSPNTVGYFFEDQTSNSVANGRPGDTDNRINDYEYGVTNNIVAPFGPWISPNDHTIPTSADGRYLVINVGTPSPGQVIYSKPILDIIPNRPLNISLYIFNLVTTDFSILDPDLTIEIIDSAGTVIESIRTGDIAKNTGPDDWVLFTADLNPGTNTTLDFVIRTEKVGNSGNDLALDDITILQLPEVCELSVETPVIVAPNRELSAVVDTFTNASCNGETDGTITFSASNFDSTEGFEYTLDGGTVWIPSTNATVTTGAVFGAGAQSIIIRKADENTCQITINQTITAPPELIATAIISTELTCTNNATITANASGGTPSYEYQLEDTTGTIIGGYSFSSNGNNRVFTGIPPGNYSIEVRDENGCEGAIAINVAPLETVQFTATPTACYDGTNNATIIADVTDGNGGYQFRIDGGLWISPNPVSATTYTFENLASGTYAIGVRDRLECPVVANTINVTISPKLTATTTVVPISACAEGSITVNALGGDGNYAYAFVLSGSTPVISDFGASNSITLPVGDEGAYDVFVRDNNAAMPSCVFQETVTVALIDAITFTAAPTNPECHGGVGAIEVTITAGSTPYSIAIVDIDNSGAADGTRTNAVTTTQQYFNLNPGNYTITTTDAYGCTTTITPITIVEPDELMAEITPMLPPDCGADPNLYGFSFDNYPTTLGTLEFSADGGANWQANDTFLGSSYAGGATVSPSVRVVGKSCRIDLPPYTIPYPLDNLDITIAAVIVGCNELQVTVQGTAGISPYQYTFSEDPASFDPATTTWTVAKPGAHLFTNLVPGRTYVFYVRDATGPPGCVRQSSVNVNDVAKPPILVTGAATPICSGQNNGDILFTVTETTIGELGGSFNWDLYEIGNTTPLESGSVSPFSSGDSFMAPNPASLLAGSYYVQISGSAPNNCVTGSENVLIEELDPITFTPVVIEDISCAKEGLIQINTIEGGGTNYTYTLTSSNFVTPINTTDNPIKVPISNLVDSTLALFDVVVSIQDEYMCTSVQTSAHTVSLNVSQSPTIANITVDNCTAPFSIAISASGGTAPYLYSIDSGSTYRNNGGTFSNVAVGVYTISVLDAKGCTVSGTATVYPALEASATITKLLDCTPNSDAIITVSGLKGSGSYDFDVTGPTPASSQIRTSIPSPTNTINWATNVTGNYTIKVYDNNTPTCIERTFTVTILPAILPIIDTISTSAVVCEGNSDGTILIKALNNGIGPYTFQITSIDGTTSVINPSITTSTTATFTGLAPTTTTSGYVVTVTGNSTSNNCTVLSNSILISEPDAITFTAATTAFACTSGNKEDSAEIMVQNIIGGSNAYSRYVFINNLNPTVILQDGTNTSYKETDTDGGTYTIKVYDTNGCEGSTSATINPFTSISSPTITDTRGLTCQPGNDAQIDVSVTINPTTATPNLEYTLVGLNTTFTATNPTGSFSGLTDGNYKITVTNLDTNCIVETVHTIGAPEEMRVVATKLTDEECLNDGIDDGSFSISTSNYTGSFDYQIYRLDDTLVSGQSGSGNTTGTQITISNIPNGTYYATLVQTQAPFCSVRSNTVTINAPEAAIAFTPTEEDNVSCTNDQGSILVNPNGGLAPYTISWLNSTTGATGVQTNVAATTFTNLSAGNYTITVTDTYSCTATETITLTRPENISATITATTLACTDDKTATVTALLGIRSTTASYRYQLLVYESETATTPIQSSPLQNTGVFENLGAGFYSIMITDSIGCSFETTKATINRPSPVSAQLRVSQLASCNTSASIELSASGGTAPYNFSTDNSSYTAMNMINGANTHVINNAGTGTFSYYVKDALNCTSVISNTITLAPIAPLTLLVDTSAAFINCSGDASAIIYAKADGALGNYEYRLYDAMPINPSSLIAGPINTGIFDNLGAGTYYVQATSEDCTPVNTAVVITTPTPLSYTETVVNVTCFNEDNGSISVSLSGGSGVYQYAISPELNQFDTINTFNDLSPGSYTIIAQDSNGCFEQLLYTITEPTRLVTTFSTTPEICLGDSDGTISLEITGGIAPYSTSINSNSTADFVAGRTTFSGLAADSYIIFVRDSNGCEINTIIEVLPGVNLNATVTPIYECSGLSPTNYLNITLNDAAVLGEVLYGLDTTDVSQMQINPDFRNTPAGEHYIAVAHENGCVQTYNFTIISYEPLGLELSQIGLNQITATASGGKSEYTYYLEDKNGVSSNAFTIYKTGTYEVSVVDENGCTARASIFMEFIDIKIPNFFTPDGDVLNDLWVIGNTETYPKILIIIFDRYGREVYRMGLNDKGWDGNYNNTPLPTGDYWYTIQLNEKEDTRKIVGHFTLYR